MWRFVYQPLQDHILKSDIRAETFLYVERRATQGGISAADIANHLAECSGQVLIVLGQAGIGKTTFLHDAIANKLPTHSGTTVWIDGLSEADKTDDRAPFDQIRDLIQRKLGKLVHGQLDGNLLEWHKFLLARLGDQEGVAGILLAQLSQKDLVPEQTLLAVATAIQSFQSRHLDYARAMCAFLLRECGQAPRIVIDNIDQLSTPEINRVLEYADLLARGSASQGARTDERAAVIVAARPISFGSIGIRTHFVKTGRLEPPAIADVLNRRLTWFLQQFNGPLARGAVVSDDDGRAVDLRELLGADASEKPLRALISDALIQIATAATHDNTPYSTSLIELVQVLTNYNTRVCLLASVQYLASGHLDWTGLTHVVSGQRRLQEVLSSRKTLMALILGVRTIYDTQSSWLCNLFFDTQNDRIGVMVRLRVLTALDNTTSIAEPSLESLARVLAELFGYPDERVRNTCKNLLSLGLLEEKAEFHLELSRGGRTYLQRMLFDFEYLQHVVVDACAPPEYFVACHRYDEKPSVRFHRVVRFAHWIREIEVDELANVYDGNQQDTYRRLYGDSSISGSISQCLQAVDWLPRREGTGWDTIQRDLDGLLRDATPEAIERDAQTLAKAKLLRRADAIPGAL
jgi:hypothetical protein